MATSVTSNDITWTFNMDCTVGQFVTGGWYVVWQSGLEITGTTPAYDSLNGYNGTMVNPLRVGNTQGQGWDSQTTFGGYDAYYDAAEAATFPLAVSSGDSVATVVSYTSSSNFNQSWSGRTVSASVTNVKSFEVLTVLASAPAAGSFRPPFSGTAKPIWNTSDITNVPTLASTASVPSDLTYYLRGTERPWLMNISGTQSRYHHPLDNMLNYHEYILDFLNELLVLVCSDSRTDELLYNFIQLGIDQYGILSSGGSGSASTAFTRIPIIVAGHFLNDSDMKNFWYTGSPPTQGREGKLFYYWADKLSTITSSIVTEGETWTGATVFMRKQEGNTEHEHLHPSEWGLVSNGGGKKQEQYRTTVDVRPHAGLVLVARILSLETEVNQGAYLDYLDRWFDEDYVDTYYPTVQAEVGSIGAPGPQTQQASAGWVKEMWTAYRDYNETPDVTPPVISNVNVTESDTSVTITWNTDEVAESLVDYGSTASYGSSESDTSFTTTHSITLTGLTAETEYHYRITSDDPSGNSSSTTDATFTTLVAITQVAAPTTNVSSGNYWNAQTVTLSTATEGAEIRYTTDGSLPDATDTLYSGPISVSTTTFIRAIGIKSGIDSSTISSFSYSFGPFAQIGNWENIVTSSKTSDFGDLITVVPDLAEVDLTIGHCEGDADAWSDLATTARLLNGVIDARNGSSYTAENVVNFTAGDSIRLRFLVNWTGKTYDLFAKVNNGAEQIIADGYSWRTGTTTATELNRIGHYESFGEGASILKTDISMTNPPNTQATQAALDSIKTDCDTLNALGVGTSTITASDLTSQDYESAINTQRTNLQNLIDDNSLSYTLTALPGTLSGAFSTLYTDLVGIEAELS